MLTDIYQEYLYLIGRLKDVYKLTVDVDHKDIHTFYKDKRPLFKLFFGMFTKEDSPSIVISFHLNLFHAEAIQLFINVYNFYPLIKLHDSWVADSKGETYLGEDALAIQEVYRSQEILGHWLDGHTQEEVKEFVEAKVLGRQANPIKSFDSLKQKDEAIIEFDRMKKPGDDEQLH